MSKKSSKKPLVDLSEEEQWKIINDTGVLHKLKETEKAPEPHFLVATLLAIPLIVCYGVFDYLAHAQFGLESEFTFAHIKSQLVVLPAIWIFAFVTNYFKKTLLGQLTMTAIACIVGCMVVHLINDDGTFGAAKNSPGLITIGVLMIIQADLQYALLPIFVTVGYYYRHLLQDYVPMGSLPSLKTEL